METSFPDISDATWTESAVIVPEANIGAVKLLFAILLQPASMAPNRRLATQIFFFIFLHPFSKKQIKTLLSK
jgi:hypothetical protein